MFSKFKSQLQKHLGKVPHIFSPTRQISNEDPKSEGKNEQDQLSSNELYIQALHDFLLLMEYKKLCGLAPAGMYIVPSSNSMRRWCGIIFIRKGHYRKGIFRFTIHIANNYPEQMPTVVFHTECFHPLIHTQTGELDLTPALHAWSSLTPQHRSMSWVAGYIKKVFYKVEWWEETHKPTATAATAAPTAAGHIPTATPAVSSSSSSSSSSSLSVTSSTKTPINRTAAHLFSKQREEFIRRVEACCLASQESVYTVQDKDKDRDNPLRITTHHPVHDIVWQRIHDHHTTEEPQQEQDKRRAQQEQQQQQTQTEGEPTATPAVDESAMAANVVRTPLPPALSPFYLSWFKPGKDSLLNGDDTNASLLSSVMKVSWTEEDAKMSREEDLQRTTQEQTKQRSQQEKQPGQQPEQSAETQTLPVDSIPVAEPAPPDNQ